MIFNFPFFIVAIIDMLLVECNRLYVNVKVAFVLLFLTSEEAEILPTKALQDLLYAFVILLELMLT